MTDRPGARWVAIAARGEDALATLTVLGVVLLPLTEVVVRRVLNASVPGAVPFTSHLTLVVGLAGAAIAARQGKLLAMATGTLLPEGRWRDAARVASAWAGSLVSVILAFGGIRLLALHRAAEKPLALGIPVWVADLAFPIAFGLIAVRLVVQSSTRLVWRGLAASGIVAGLLIARAPGSLEGAPVWPGVVLLVTAAVLGMPVFALLGGLAAFLFMAQGDHPATAIVGSYGQLTATDLPALPLFTLTGFLLAEGRTSERLLSLFRACFGWMPGGTAVVTATLCAFFTVFSGGSGVTILALGGLLLPALAADGYRERFSLGLITAAGSLGLLFPPALPLILYGIVAGVAIGDLFIGGLLPGLVMLLLLAVLGVREESPCGCREADSGLATRLAPRGRRGGSC